jgi:dihydroflavonol-4-reductase
MRALVTGATGFVGFHIAQLLLRKNVEVTALVRQETDASFLSRDGIDIYRGDLRDFTAVRNAMRGCSQVYHAGADYRLWVRDPATMYETNVKGTTNVMSAARELNTERVVYTSTAGTLAPGSKTRPSSEQTSVRASHMIGDYKKTKYIAEREVERFAGLGVPAVIVNPTAPIGAADRKPTPTGKIIVDFLNRRLPAYIDTGLNFVAVRDVALGHWLAASKGRTGERYLLGGDNMSLSQFLASLARIAGREPPRLKLPYAPVLFAAWINGLLAHVTGRCPLIPLTAVRMARHYMFFDCGKAEKELGFSKSPVTDAIQEAVRWYEEAGYVRTQRRKMAK